MDKQVRRRVRASHAVAGDGVRRRTRAHPPVGDAKRAVPVDLPANAQPERSRHAAHRSTDWVSVAGTPDDIVVNGSFSPFAFLAVSPGADAGRVGFLAHDSSSGRRAMYLYTSRGTLQFCGWTSGDFHTAFRAIMDVYHQRFGKRKGHTV